MICYQWDWGNEPWFPDPALQDCKVPVVQTLTILPATATLFDPIDWSWFTQ